MIIRVDKCCTFGIRKAHTSSVQYLPKLIVNSDRIPPVEINNTFTYLGRDFNFLMDDTTHKEELVNTTNNLLSIIENLPLTPKNKCLIYQRYVLSKISWDLTVTEIGKIWVMQNLDRIIQHHIRKWFEIPIAGTLDTLMLPRKHYGIALLLPSQKFIQCQTVKRNALKKSPNEDIIKLHQSTCYGKNIQFDMFNSSQEVMKSIHHDKKSRLENTLKTQGFIITSIIRDSLQVTSTIWLKMQSSLPKNIYSFTMRYLNNTLATRGNLSLWKLHPNSLCSLCLQHESLLHVVAGCKEYLNQGRFTWRHDSVIYYLAKVLSSENRSIYADIEQHKSPSFITGIEYRPDLLVVYNETLYVLELTVGFETNMIKNGIRKEERYKDLIATLRTKYSNVKLINLSLGSLGIFSKPCKSFFHMLKDLDFNESENNTIVKKIMNICVRTTYYIFCRRNKDWLIEELFKY